MDGPDAIKNEWWYNWVYYFQFKKSAPKNHHKISHYQQQWDKKMRLYQIPRYPSRWNSVTQETHSYSIAISQRIKLKILTGLNSLLSLLPLSSLSRLSPSSKSSVSQDISGLYKYLHRETCHFKTISCLKELCLQGHLKSLPQCYYLVVWHFKITSWFEELSILGHLNSFPQCYHWLSAISYFLPAQNLAFQDTLSVLQSHHWAICHFKTISQATTMTSKTEI